ncbi:hypothetical protein LguiB_002621 [Lonicera macranthoides]
METDIIPYILCRLPIKTLSSCRLVCKSWLHLISSPYFVDFYEAHSPTILGLPALNTGNYRDSYLLDFNKGDGRPALVRPQFNNSSFLILASCNGLVCFNWGRSQIYIWNPILDHCLPLPELKDEIWKSSNFKIVYGFGYSRRTNQYKVLRILKSWANNGIVLAEICTFGTRTWRDVTNMPKGLQCSEDHCKFFNGALHWIVRDESSDKLICAFEIESEGFGFVDPPVTFDWKKRKRFDWSNVGAFRGCLCICASDALDFRPDYEVWVMKEYGVKDSWVKEFLIKSPLVEWWNPYRRFELLKFIDGDDGGGEILILCGDFDLFAYNMKTCTYKPKWQTTYPQIAIVPSFVSLWSLLND